MIFSTEQIRTRSDGFSFIEVLLSLVLVATALVTLMALVPAGLKASRRATNSVILAHILEDAHERMEGHALKDGAFDDEPFFYDDEGIFVTAPQQEEDKSNPRFQRRLYRVDIQLASPDNDEIRKNTPNLKAVMLTIAWPVNPLSGEVSTNKYSSNRETITYYVNAMTGNGWNKIDPNYEVLIEF